MPGHDAHPEGVEAPPPEDATAREELREAAARIDTDPPRDDEPDVAGALNDELVTTLGTVTQLEAPTGVFEIDGDFVLAHSIESAVVIWREYHDHLDQEQPKCCETVCPPDDLIVAGDRKRTAF